MYTIAQKLKKSLFTSFLVQFFVLQVAYSTSVAKLLQQNERPTMLQVREILSAHEFPEDIPVNKEWGTQNFDKRLEIKKWTQKLIRHAPKIIATMEKAFPRAKFIFLGRDGAAFADVFEAFYLSIGQKNRVFRLGVSKATIESMTSSDLIEYLKNQGLDPQKFSASTSHILIDTVSQGGGRQGRTILSRVYDFLLRKTKLTSAQLARALNFVGLRVSTTKNIASLPIASHLEVALLNLEQQIEYARVSIKESEPRVLHLFKFHPLITIDEAAYARNEAGYTHFIGGWHGSFGPFKRKHGVIQPTPGTPFDEKLRYSVLWMQREIWRHVDNGYIQRQIHQAARSMQYDFTKLYPDSCNKTFN